MGVLTVIRHNDLRALTDLWAHAQRPSPCARIRFHGTRCVTPKDATVVGTARGISFCVGIAGVSRRLNADATESV